MRHISKKKTPAVLMAIMAVLLAQVATAQPVESGGYLGLAAGSAKYDDVPDDEFTDYTENSFGGSDTAYAIYGGYRFNSWFGLEGRYADLGETDATYLALCPPGFGCVPEASTFNATVETDRMEISALGVVPIGENFELYGKAGYARAKSDVRIRETSAGETTSIPGSSDTQYSSGPIFGIGARYNFSAPWSLRAEWERTQLKDLGESSFDMDIDTIWLSAEYRFGM